MKLLVLYQEDNNNIATAQQGYYQGFERLVAEGLLSAHAAIPFYAVAARLGWDGMWAEAEQTARTMQADAIFLQFFHGAIPDPTTAIQRLKRLPGKPTIFTSLGDPYGRWTKKVPQSFRISSALADVSFLTGMGYVARQLEHWGSRNLVLMPWGCCQVQFSSPLQLAGSEPEFDVAFIGSRIRSRNPASHFFWVTRRRVELVAAFTKRYGRRFGLFGKGWEGNGSWQGSVPFARQHDVYQRSAVALGGMPNADHDYYTSDRPFIAVASGVPLVDYAVRGVERILEPGVDWWLADSISGLLRRCDELLELSQAERIRLGERARERVLASHTLYHRCREMAEIVRDLRNARMSGRRLSAPKLTFLSPPRSGAHDSPAAIVAWQG